MRNYDDWKDGVTVNNCNARLDILYKERDKIGERIDKLIVMGYDITAAEAEYSNIVDVINDICQWRREHPGCLTEGDPGYGV